MHTGSIFAGCEFTISAYGAASGPLIKVDASSSRTSPANYRRRIYGVVPLSRLALPETCVRPYVRMYTYTYTCACTSTGVEGKGGEGEGRGREVRKCLRMNADSRRGERGARLFRATVTSPGRDVIPGVGGRFMAPGPGNAKVDSRPSCRKRQTVS